MACGSKPVSDGDSNTPNDTGLSAAVDKDNDGVTDDLDCDDSDDTVGSVEEDADCDGTLTDDDCDDNNDASYTKAEDGDCDGVLTADDCDDTDGIADLCLTCNGPFHVNGSDSAGVFKSLKDCQKITSYLDFTDSNLTDLNGLQKLTEITGDLRFYGNSALQSLTGLENLTTIGQDLKIWTNESLYDLEGLQSLVSIDGDLDMQENRALSNINKGLPSLKNVAHDAVFLSNTNLCDSEGSIFQKNVIIGSNFIWKENGRDCN